MNRLAAGNDAGVSRKPQQATRQVDVPPATRSRPPGWRDPRLWVGVALVTGSVVAGARIMAAADDLTPVWSASGDLVAGDTIGADDLVAARVRFDDAEDRERYLPVDAALPEGLTLTRPLGQGELVPAAALGAAQDDGRVEVSIAVPAEHVPTGLARGSRVDVWVIGEDRRARASAELVLSDVLVLDAPVVTDAFAAATSRQLVLALPAAEEEPLAQVLAASGDDRVRVVGRG